MKIVRTYKEGGELWGETSKGARIKWDEAACRWDKSSMHHPSAESSKGSVGPSAKSSDLRFGARVQILEPGERPPDEFEGANFPSLGPIDEAWNRKFPAWSGSRLLFLLVALPFVGLLYAGWGKLMHGEDFSWGPYLFGIVMGSILMISVFGYRWWKSKRVKQRRSWSPSRPMELLISTGFFFIGLAASTAMVDIRAVTPLLLGSFLGVSLLISVLLHFRAWMIMAVLLSAAGGFVIAIFLTMFNTFMGGSTNVFLNWLMASGFVFLFLGPIAWGFKKKTESFESRHRIPTWLIAALVCVFMLASTAFFAITEGNETMDEAAATNGPPHLRSTAMSPRIATQMLISAWQKRSRVEAEKLAPPEVVDYLFAQSRLTYQGCGYLKKSGSEYRCMIQTSAEMIILEGIHTNGGFYMGNLERAPLTTKLY